MSALPASVDVIVVGGGNAGFAAATAAAEAGAKDVILVDKCPEEWVGGNTYFTAGGYRAVHGGLSDLLPLVNNVDEPTSTKIDLDPYTPADFRRDIDRICGGRSDPALTQVLIDDSNDTVKWLHKHGVRFQLSFNRQSFFVDGRYKFWGGMALKTDQGGKGLVEDHRKAAAKVGVKVFFSTPVTELHVDQLRGSITGVTVQHNGLPTSIQAKAVILAAGGFEASPTMRAKYLGPGWDMASVRGTPYNTGDLLEIAVRDAAAERVGHWSGCHATCWDANAPKNQGDRQITNEFTKSGYPLGVMVNSAGERFVDEGVDYRNYTYAIFGRAILQQPNSFVFQVWDKKTIPWLRSEEYRDEIVERITANSIEELAKKLSSKGLTNEDNFVKTLKDYNHAVHAYTAENPSLKWDPAVKDNVSTQGKSERLPLGKTNWAKSIDEAPFLAVKVTGGITFTFGGLRIDPETAGVVSGLNGKKIPGLYCTGEMVGGLFYTNYPGGSGLTAGAVFGRRAGVNAAKLAAGAATGASIPVYNPRL